MQSAGEILCNSGDENPALSEGVHNQDDCLDGMNHLAFQTVDDMLAD